MATAEEVERILGNPVFSELTDNALKIRRNLLVTAVIALFTHYASIQIKKDTPFLGVHFEGLDNGKIELGLLILLVYFLSHFFWYVWDSFCEWRLRLTGMSKLKSVLEEGGDVGDNPRNSTLYNWWRVQSESIRAATLEVDKIAFTQDALKNVIERDKAFWEPYQVNSQLHDIDLKLDYIRQYVKRIMVVMEDQRFQISLRRFDGWFKHFIRSQNARWLIFEVSLPIGLGLWAIGISLSGLITVCRTLN